MVVSKETLDALKEIGLNMYQRKIYAALLSRGVSTAGELSEMTGVPRSRAYDVLESLSQMGFAILKPSKPREYVAVPPEQALENAKRVLQEKFEDQVKKIERFKRSEYINELNDLYNQGLNLVDPSDLAGALKGRYNIYQHVGGMLKEAEKNIKILTTERGLNELYENHFDVLRKAREKGVEIRILSPLTERNRHAYEVLSEIAEIRDLKEKEVNGRIFMVDDRKMAFSLTSEEVHPTQDTAFWTESDHLTSEMFRPAFELLWNQSE